MNLPLTIACWDYDRTRTLFDGRTQIESVDANSLNLPVEETFFRALRHKEFDIAELGLSSHTLVRLRGDAPYTAVPVFLSRMFRYSAVYIRSDSGIRQPKDLIGWRVGVPEFQLTAPVWVRGILEAGYGMHPADLRWHTGGVETPRRHEKVTLTVPGVSIQAIPDDQTLNQWLLEGKIDGLIAPRAPSSFEQGDSRVRRLFTDLRITERDYFSRTRIFSIMHVLGIRDELVASTPGSLRAWSRHSPMPSRTRCLNWSKWAR